MKRGEIEISVSTLREDLPNLLARVQLLGESFAIMKHGKKTAVIRPVEGGDDVTGTATNEGGELASEKLLREGRR